MLPLLQELLPLLQEPLPEAFEVLSIAAVTGGLLDEVPAEEVGKFEKGLHEYVKKHDKKLLETLSSGAKVTDDIMKQLAEVTKKFKKTF